jgi:hypothetical protein
MDELKDRSDNTTEVFPEYKTSDLNIFYKLSKHNSLKSLFTKLDGTYWTSCEEGNVNNTISTNAYQLSSKSNISEIKMVGADYEAGDVIPDTYESDEVVWSTLWTQCKKNNDFTPLGKWCMDELKDPNHDYYQNNRVYYYYYKGISMQDAIGYLSKATGTWHPYKSTKTKSMSLNLWGSPKNSSYSIRPICKF